MKKLILMMFALIIAIGAKGQGIPKLGIPKYIPRNARIFVLTQVIASDDPEKPIILLDTARLNAIRDDFKVKIDFDTVLIEYARDIAQCFLAKKINDSGALMYVGKVETMVVQIKPITIKRHKIDAITIVKRHKIRCIDMCVYTSFFDNIMYFHDGDRFPRRFAIQTNDFKWDCMYESINEKYYNFTYGKVYDN